MSINLLYHDVTQPEADDESGFPGPEAARYKLTQQEFARHLDQIASAVHGLPISSVTGDSSRGWMMTFDDGGISAATTIADELQRRQWRGWFFIATDFINRPGFCTSDQIRELHRQGHVIGSHSCSHPERISSCSPEQLDDEWSRSCAILSEIVGARVTTASVPGGFYSSEVARSASRAGIKLLFNSEPTTGEFAVDGCRILGRYNVYRGMSARDAASLIASPLRRWRQSVFWTAKKAAKTVAGPLYKAMRRRLLQRAYAS